ncbi:hypothetical protein B0H13DRAFT_1908151 [Mycena leptocephala]|nr:hypothetical protein B0H13DRAFT_1908151 [Mycena leptocephala]
MKRRMFIRALHLFLLRPEFWRRLRIRESLRIPQPRKLPGSPCNVPQNRSARSGGSISPAPSSRSTRSSGSVASRLAADCVEEWDTVDHSDEPLCSGSDLAVKVDPETGRLCDDWYEPEEFEDLLKRRCGPDVTEGEESEDEELESDEPKSESDGEDEPERYLGTQTYLTNPIGHRNTAQIEWFAEDRDKNYNLAHLSGKQNIRVAGRDLRHRKQWVLKIQTDQAIGNENAHPTSSLALSAKPDEDFWPDPARVSKNPAGYA